ncbi:hypothetical protein D3C72_915400 [compost metagenome]
MRRCLGNGPGQPFSGFDDIARPLQGLDPQQREMQPEPVTFLRACGLDGFRQLGQRFVKGGCGLRPSYLQAQPRQRDGFDVVQWHGRVLPSQALHRFLATPQISGSRRGIPTQQRKARAFEL